MARQQSRAVRTLEAQGKIRFLLEDCLRLDRVLPGLKVHYVLVSSGLDDIISRTEDPANPLGGGEGEVLRFLEVVANLLIVNGQALIIEPR